MSARTYHIKGREFVIVDGDHRARPRLKRRGFTRLTVSEMPSRHFYTLVKDMEPGSYEIKAFGPPSYLQPLSRDLSRS